MSGLGQDTDFLWYGWPGLTVPPAERPLVEKTLRREYKAVPVFMDEELACKHYNGFSSLLLYTSRR
jgi:trehalose 6-phosphate synthase